MAAPDQRSLPELISGLAGDVTTLFRKEVQLAKAEAAESVGKAMHGVQYIAIGAVLAIGALGVLLSAAVSLVAAAFVGLGMGTTGASALAAVIVGILVALLAYAMIKRGTSGLTADNLGLDRTVNSVARDASVIKEKVNG